MNLNLKQLIMLAIIGLFGWAPQVWAQLDAPSQEALDKTQALLKSKTEREKYIQNHPDAAAADGRVKALSGSAQDQQAVYDLSAKVFSTTTQQTGGDAQKQQDLLQKASTDPEGFFKSLPPEQQAQIRDLASQLEKHNGVVAAPK